MALITKQILVCNKCGASKESVEPNVTILGEPFYFCDDCLETMLNWVSRQIPKVDETVPEKSEEQTVVTSKNKRSASYMHWDDYNIDRLLSLREQGYSYDGCAESLGTTNASVMCILSKIRSATVGSNLYPYQARLLSMGKVLGARKRKVGDN